MEIKIKSSVVPKIRTDIDSLTGEYNDLSNYFDLLLGQMQNAMPRYQDLDDDEMVDHARRDVMGEEDIDLDYQMETVLEVFKTGLGNIFQDFLQLLDLKYIGELEDMIVQDRELKESDSAQKVIELIHIYKSLDSELNLDEIMNLKQLRPDYFEGHEHDNVYSIMKLLSDNFLDYCDSLHELISLLMEKTK